MSVTEAVLFALLTAFGLIAFLIGIKLFTKYRIELNDLYYEYTGLMDGKSEADKQQMPSVYGMIDFRFEFEMATLPLSKDMPDKLRKRLLVHRAICWFYVALSITLILVAFLS